MKTEGKSHNLPTDYISSWKNNIMSSLQIQQTVASSENELVSFTRMEDISRTVSSSWDNNLDLSTSWTFYVLFFL